MEDLLPGPPLARAYFAFRVSGVSPFEEIHIVIGNGEAAVTAAIIRGPRSPGIRTGCVRIDERLLSDRQGAVRFRLLNQTLLGIGRSLVLDHLVLYGTRRAG